MLFEEVKVATLSNYFDAFLECKLPSFFMVPFNVESSLSTKNPLSAIN